MNMKRNFNKKKKRKEKKKRGQVVVLNSFATYEYDIHPPIKEESVLRNLDVLVPEFRHCDEFIDDETQPLCLRKFLRYCRWPAIYQFRAHRLGITKPRLFANYGGKLVRVVMASRFGDVGITGDLEADSVYDLRVAVGDLINFSGD